MHTTVGSRLNSKYDTRWNSKPKDNFCLKTLNVSSPYGVIIGERKSRSSKWGACSNIWCCRKDARQRHGWGLASGFHGQLVLMETPWFIDHISYYICLRNVFFGKWTQKNLFQNTCVLPKYGLGFTGELMGSLL